MQIPNKNDLMQLVNKNDLMQLANKNDLMQLSNKNPAHSSPGTYTPNPDNYATGYSRDDNSGGEKSEELSTQHD